jgi:hypothetical protein
LRREGAATHYSGKNRNRNNSHKSPNLRCSHSDHYIPAISKSSQAETDAAALACAQLRSLPTPDNGDKSALTALLRGGFGQARSSFVRADFAQLRNCLQLGTPRLGRFRFPAIDRTWIFAGVRLREIIHLVVPCPTADLRALKFAAEKLPDKR